MMVLLSWYVKKIHLFYSIFKYTCAKLILCTFIHKLQKDLDRQKLFLHRTKLENIKLCDLFVGNKLYVLGRHMVILDYGDGVTKDYCEPHCERAFLLVRPEAVANLPCIVHRLEKCFRILFAKMARMTREMAYELNKSDEGEEYHAYINLLLNLWSFFQ